MMTSRTWKAFGSHPPYIVMVKNQLKLDEPLLIIFWMVVIGAMSLIIDYHYLLTPKAEG